MFHIASNTALARQTAFATAVCRSGTPERVANHGRAVSGNGSQRTPGLHATVLTRKASARDDGLADGRDADKRQADDPCADPALEHLAAGTERALPCGLLQPGEQSCIRLRIPEPSHPATPAWRRDVVAGCQTR